MKHIIILSVVHILIAQPFTSALAQIDSLKIQYDVKKTYVIEDSIKRDNAQYIPALSVYIPESDALEVKKTWERKVKHKTKSKFVQQGDVHILYQTLLEEVSSMPINIYNTYSQQNEEMKLTVAFEINNDFLSSKTMIDRYSSAREFLKQFGIEQYKTSVRKVLKGEKKELRSQEGVMRRLFNEKRKLESQIKIRELNISEQQESASYVKVKARVIDAKTDSMLQYGGQMTDKEKEKVRILKQEHKSLQRQAKGIEKKIINHKTYIQKANHSIDSNVSNQALQKQRIRRQLSVVKSLEEKLDAIE